ncbi:MAG: M24 family metallopeptidase [Candidatus Limnocylindrales bacterium]
MSTQERDRRWDALRTAAAADGLDAVIFFGHGEGQAIFQYATNAQHVVGHFVLPTKAAPTALTGRPIGRGWVLRSGWLDDIRKVADAPGAMAEILIGHGIARGTIGLAGHPGVFPVDELARLRGLLPGATFRDASGLVARIVMVKSDEEVAAMRETSDILREAFRAMEAVIRPGISEREAIAEHTRVMRRNGGYDGYCVVNRAPYLSEGMPTDDVFRADDMFSIYSEQVGPSGYWCEVSHQYSFGPPPAAVTTMHAIRVEAFAACVAAMRAGNTTGDIMDAMNRAYARHGYDTEGLISYAVHGIGLTADEPPYLPGDHLTLEAGMILSLHPHVRFKDGAEEQALPRSGPCDNVLVTATGGEPLTDSAWPWIELPH